MKPTPVFDHQRNGIVIVQDGTIYYSPNVVRAVQIPLPNYEPFKRDRLNASLFKQPVWWSFSWGWQSFIPLSPSFTSSPFEPFCWMPRIKEITVYRTLPSGIEEAEKRWKMRDNDILLWKKHEELFIEAAQIIRLQYTIPGNPPPKPSSFHYDKAHKSIGIAKCMISVSRDWFVIWMGFMSYIISQTRLRGPNSTVTPVEVPLPFWYTYLWDEHGYADSWLDGLLMSTVCSFDAKTPRTGVIFRWSETDKYRPPIDWFYENHVPLWFPWTIVEERALLVNGSLEYLRPPVDLVQEALMLLFHVPNIPLAGLIMQQYLQLGNDPITNETLEFLRLEHAPSFVFNFVADRFVSQTSAIRRNEATASATLKALKASQEQKIAEAPDAFPLPKMLEWAEEEKGHLFDHPDVFFAARRRRQEELIKVEDDDHRRRRLAREANPGIRHSTMYTWEKTHSSGSRELWMRVRVNKKWNADVYSFYRKSQRVFNAFADEWDFCEDFCFGSDDEDDSESDDYGDDYGYDNDDYDTRGHPHTVVDDSSAHSEPADHALDIIEEPEDFPQPSYSRDVLETMRLVYGYSSPLVAIAPPSSFNWEAILRFLGFVTDLNNLAVPMHDEHAIALFFSQITRSNSTISTDIDDLSEHSPLPLLSLFDFSLAHRPVDDLFVFTSPKSTACNWVLGVHSPSAALYVCRYILSNPLAHTVLTVAHRLLERGIPFRMLLLLPCSSRQTMIQKFFKPTSFRLLRHVFKSTDFEAYVLQCKAFLSSPQGRAALLQGGIVSRIAKEFISVDGVLEGPSVEVTAHRVGYIMSSGNPGLFYCDDELTEHEIAMICGTYMLYTDLKQEAVRSWFPPPSAWKANRCGNKWLDWTERCESLFLNILQRNRAGTYQPRSHTEWATFLKGQTTVKVLAEANDKRAKEFMDYALPSQ